MRARSPISREKHGSASRLRQMPPKRRRSAAAASWRLSYPEGQAATTGKFPQRKRFFRSLPIYPQGSDERHPSWAHRRLSGHVIAQSGLKEASRARNRWIGQRLTENWSVRISQTSTGCNLPKPLDTHETSLQRHSFFGRVSSANERLENVRISSHVQFACSDGDTKFCEVYLNFIMVHRAPRLELNATP